MSAETAALLGVIAGALLTGIVQSLIQWTERRRRGRAAARIIYAEVHLAEDAFETATERGDWWQLSLSTEGWHQYRDDLAASMSVQDFNTVAGAYYGVELLEQWRTQDNPFPLDAVDERVAALSRAAELLTWQGHTLGERRGVWIRSRLGGERD